MSKTEMPVLKGWSAKRAGAYITITHSAGKITQVETIGPRLHARTHASLIVAKAADGRHYVLAAD